MILCKKKIVKYYLREIIIKIIIRLNKIKYIKSTFYPYKSHKRKNKNKKY